MSNSVEVGRILATEAVTSAERVFCERKRDRRAGFVSGFSTRGHAPRPGGHVKRSIFVLFVMAGLTAACNGNTAADAAGGASKPDAAATGGMSMATAAKTPEFREVTIPAGTSLALDL